MTTSEKITKFVIQLNRETAKNEIGWTRKDITYDLNAEAQVIGYYYLIDYKGKRFLLYKYRDKHYTDYEEWKWYDSYSLDLVSDNLQKIRTVTQEAAVVDLYDTVTFKDSGLKEFLDDLF